MPTCHPLSPRWPRLLLVVLLLMAHCSIAVQTPAAYAANQIWYVKHDASSGGNGTSWASAFTDLQAALAEAEATDQIWVASGVYYPTDSSTLRTASFVLKNGVALYGGFVGNESQLSQRDWELNKTILSGDIDRNDTHTNGIVIDTTGLNGDNSYHVVTATYLDASAIIDGFVITAGRANGLNPDNLGGAIYNSNASPTISNISFSGNFATLGGAIFNNTSSSPTITNVSFSGNSATYGGAIYNNNSSPTITNASFSGNSATYDGGANYNNINSSPTITNVSFSGNSASADGGAISNWYSSPIITHASFSGNSARYGGAIDNWYSSPIITHASFSGNSARYGGGAIYNYISNPTITNTSFSGNSATINGGAIHNYDNSSSTITNASFSGNATENYGGAIHNSNGSSSPITNASFSGNAASDGGAIHNVNDSSATITNASFSGNSATRGGATFSYHSSLTISNTIVWGNSSSIYAISTYPTIITASLIEGCNPAGSWNSACGNNSGGNLVDADPLFVNPISYTSAPTTTGDLRLLVNSPAIDTGNNGDNSTTEDLDGKPRIIGTKIDLGAYEHGQERYSLVSSIQGKGSITQSPDLLRQQPGSSVTFTTTSTLGWHVPNSTVTLTATANPGWSFAGWSGDLSGTSSPTTLLINTNKNITATFSNDPPTANAGSDQTVVAGALVTLDGGASSDADPTQTLSYAWTQTAGPNISLSDSSAVSPSFTPTISGTYTFSLVVTDSLNLPSLADTVTITVTNDPPIANAGADRTVVAGTTVTLDGSGSSDPDGHFPLSYGWTQTDGPAVSLSVSSAVSPSFTPTISGTLTFSLVVTDSVNLPSLADAVTITVTNDPPIAHAGADQAVLVTTQVTLNGSASSDPDGHTPLTYGWTQTAGTPVTLTDANTAQPTFTAPSAADALTFSLVVTDNLGLASTADSVTITVTNGEPVANAGPDQTVVAGSTVTLDGSGSSDPDGHLPLTYGWTQTGGLSVALTGANTAQPTFTAPSVAGTLTFSLVVTDSMGLASQANTVTITVTNDPPIADAGTDQTVVAGSTVTLDGSGSSDPDGHTPLTYGWTQTAGTPVTLTGANTAQPTFTAPSVAGTLTFSLVVTDSMGLPSAADSVTITVVQYRLHLPLLMRPEPQSNLVVTALQGDQNGISLVIRNTGDAPTKEAFWVDVYINPSQPPPVNMPWHQIAPAGAVWGVNRALAPGESLTLTRSSPFYAPEYSSGTFQAGAVLYAFVDSYGTGGTHGAELESSELDNRFGPVTATAAGNARTPGNVPRSTPMGLPAR